jgi:hypothetical protein
MEPPTFASVPTTGSTISIVSKHPQGNLSFSMLIPANFFNTTQRVTVYMLDENAIQAAPRIQGTDLEAEIAGPIFDINSVQGSSISSATLFLPYRNIKSKRGDDSYIFRIFYFDDFNDIWVLSETSVDDKVSLRVSTNTSHFSLWTVISTKLLPGPSVADLPKPFDWKLALYIGIPSLGLMMILLVFRLIRAKLMHVKNSRYIKIVVCNMILILTNCCRLYMQSVLRVQQENAPNIEEWYRKQQAGTS